MLTCNECKYWNVSSSPITAGLGECRRYPPEGVRMFPLTNKDDWCGEFKAKESCGICSGDLPTEYLYNPKLETALAQSMEGRICRKCFDILSYLFIAPEEFAKLEASVVGKRVMSHTKFKGTIRGLKNTCFLPFVVEFDECPEFEGKDRMCEDLQSQFIMLDAISRSNDLQ